MTTMIEGFMTRLNARRDGEPCQEANSEMAEASSLPVGMIHKQQRDVRGGKGSLTWENRVYPREPQVGKGEIRCVGEGVTTPPPPPPPT